MSTGKLADFLVELFERTHRFANQTKAQARTVLQCLSFRDQTQPATTGYGTAQKPYPARWAADSGFDPANNVYWGEGVWG